MAIYYSPSKDNISPRFYYSIFDKMAYQRDIMYDFVLTIFTLVGRQFLGSSLREREYFLICCTKTDKHRLHIRAKTLRPSKH